MLVLSRRPEENLVFPSLGISIQVLRSSTSQVRLGISAPRDVRVLRGELLDSEPSDPSAIQGPVDAGSDTRALRAKIREASRTLDELHGLTEEVMSDSVEESMLKVIEKLQTLDKQVAALASKTISNKRNGEPVRILVVDDNVNESKLLCSYLRIKGAEVACAANGMEALEQIDTFDVVLLDMNMPKFDGKWTIDQIRSDNGLDSLTVFAVSGMDCSESNVEIGPKGVNHWFHKPLDPEQLANAISQKYERDAMLAI